MKRIDVHIGDKYGRLTVVSEPFSVSSPCGQKKRKVRCKCECGTEKDYFLDLIRRGHTVSCGCFNLEMATQRRRTHGTSYDGIYHVYYTMLSRCTNPKNKAYNRYGGKGITVCEEWANSYMSFYNWAMSNGWKQGLTIDRIDNNKGYCPSNCRWTTMKVQSNNRINSKYHTIGGESKTLSQWCDIYGKKYDTVKARLSIGWTLKDALEKPVKKLNYGSDRH